MCNIRVDRIANKQNHPFPLKLIVARARDECKHIDIRQGCCKCALPAESMVCSTGCHHFEERKKYENAKKSDK